MCFQANLTCLELELACFEPKLDYVINAQLSNLA